MREFTAIAKSLINLFYPIRCLGCGKDLDALDKFHVCDRCTGSIAHNAMPPLQLDIPSVRAYSACLYEGTIKELIHSFKYKSKTVLVALFSKIMIDYIKNNPEIYGVDIITAVPLHRKRLKEREFNQSLLLANKISNEFAMPLKHTLEKARKTRCQNELNKSERLINLKGAFKVSKNTYIQDKDILLIDDVMTTGATLNECSGTLLSGGAKSVTCLTLARGI